MLKACTPSLTTAFRHVRIHEYARLLGAAVVATLLVPTASRLPAHT